MWRKFWEGLNIRKFLALAFTLTYCTSIFILLFFALKTTDKEVIMWGLGGVGTILGTVMGYYFGYTNGQATPLDKNDSK